MIFNKHTANVHKCSTKLLSRIIATQLLGPNLYKQFVIPHIRTHTVQTKLSIWMHDILFKSAISDPWKPTVYNFFLNQLLKLNPGMFTDRSQTVNRMTRRLSVTEKNQG